MDILGLSQRLTIDAQRLREDAAEIRACDMQGRETFFADAIESLEREAKVLDDVAMELGKSKPK